MYPFKRFCGTTQLELVEYLRSTRKFKSERVFDVMCKVDRAKYVHPTGAYIDAPQGIGFNATISAPHIHAMVLECLDNKLCDGSRVLDVGSGSGYLTACLALMVGNKGLVVGIDHISQLQESAKKNISKDHAELLKSGRIELIVGDGRLGYPPKAPYDVIHVGAFIDKDPEVETLINQLAPGGRIIAPIYDSDMDGQVMFQIDKTMDGQILKKRLANVIFVPLTDKAAQVRGSCASPFKC